MQYTTEGTLNWVKKIGAPNQNTDIFGENRVLGIQLLGNTLYTSIETNKNCDLDPSDAEVKYTSSGASSLLFATYSTQGNYQKSFHLDTPLLSTLSKGFEMLASSSFVTTGTFQKDTDFDPTSGVNLLKTDPKGFAYFFDKDIYIAKYKIESVTAVSPSIAATELKVYPIPFTNQITIENNSGSVLKSLKLFNLEGQLIVSKTGAISRIDTQHLNSGVYILDATFNDGKFVRQRITKN